MKIQYKKSLFSLMALVLVLLLVACGGNGDGNDSEEVVDEGGDTTENVVDGEDIRIEIIAKGFQHDFWRAVMAGAEEQAALEGVTINFVGPSSETAIAEQIDMLNSAINRQPHAIGFAALDTNASIDAINRAYEAGIPIIGFDSGVPDAPVGTIVANVATDNYAAGELAATGMFPGIEDKLVDAQNSAVRIGVVSQEVNSLSIYARTAGFVDQMYALLEADANIGAGNIAIIGHSRFVNDVNESQARAIIEIRVPADATDALGRTEAQTLLNQEDLIGIYGSNEFGANALINADDMLSQGRIGVDVIAVGFDSGTMQNNAIRSGRFFGSVTQNPVKMGAETVRLAVAAIRGEAVGVDTGAVWYNAANIDDPEIEALLYE